MEFRTVIDLPDYGFRLGHEQKGLLVGSCFAVSVGERMKRMKMPVTVNPFGVVYNPLSIVETLGRIEQGDRVSEPDLREHNSLWFSFSHHGSFASPNRDEALANIGRSIADGHRALAEADYLILTLGTSWVFELIETGKVVNNCHKVPASSFRRFRLEPEEIVAAFAPLFERSRYRQKKIILTVSPVRHLKDGAAGNQLSKAALIVAAHRLAEQFEHVHYFPSYELMMDDLRDYRFYERDMLHPSAVALDYIWKRFSETLIGEESRKLFKRIEKILSAREHRPFNPNTPGHRAFKNATLAEIIELRGQYPLLDLSEELHYFSE